MKELSAKELEQLEEKLIAGAIVELGDKYLKETKWSGPKVFVLQLLYFDAGGDFSGVDEAPGYLLNNDPTDPDSIYHLFGNDFEYWYDCKVYETPENFATARLEAYKAELVEWLKSEEHKNQTFANQWKGKSDLQEFYNMGRLWACRDLITHLTKKENDESK